MMRGSTPATAPATRRARGVRPYFFTAASEATIIATAPSLTPLALPAVTVPPSLRKGVPSLASLSTVVPARGCSSLSTTIGSPLRCGIRTGTISFASRPFSCAATALAWLHAANLSWSSRLIWNCSATFSAVSGMASRPNFFAITGFGKRQPMVVSNIWTLREKGSVALPMT